MTTLQNVLVFIHLLGMAAIIGGFFSTMKTPRAIAPMVWGARLQLLSGLAMVGVIESQKWQINNGWVAVKLVVAFIVVALLEISAAKEKKGESAAVLVQAAAVLTVVNIAVAVFWN